MNTSNGTTTSGAPLQTLPFISKPTMIPQLGADGRWNGKIVKVELVLLRGLDGGARQHLWLIPDPRPHNHPWERIDCKVIRGWYRAIEYIPDGAGGFTEREVVLRAGDPEHRLLHGEHHQVVEVAPGTISVMSFGPVVGDGKQWGHLVKDGGTYRFELAQPMGGFVDALWHCNLHLRREGWADPYAGEPVPDLAEVMAGVGL